MNNNKNNYNTASNYNYTSNNNSNNFNNNTANFSSLNNNNIISSNYMNSNLNQETSNNYNNGNINDLLLDNNSNDENILNQDPYHERSLRFHCDTVTGIVFNPNQKQLITSSLDKTVLLWNLVDSSYKPVKLAGHKGGINDISISPNGQLIVSASSDYTLRIWDNSFLWQGHTYQSLKIHSAPVKSCHFSCDSKLIVTGSDDKTVKLINVADKKVVSVLSEHENWLKSTRFSNDGTMILSAGDDKKAKIWDVAKENCIYTFNHPGFVNSVRFHPDDTCFATACHDKKIRVSSFIFILLIQIFDVRSKELVQVYSKHTEAVNGIDFNPNGLQLASTSYDKTVKIWDLRKGDLIYTLNGHSGATSSVAFAQNGQYFSSGAQDSLVILWKSNCLSEKQTYKNALNSFPRQFLKNDPLNEPVKIELDIKSEDNLSEELSKFFEKMVYQLEILTKTLHSFDYRLNKVEGLLDNIKHTNPSILQKNEMVDKIRNIKQEYQNIYDQVNYMNEMKSGLERIDNWN